MIKKLRRKFGKKGEGFQFSYLFWVILALISFAIILPFLIMYLTSTDDEKQICKNSIVARAIVTELLTERINLNCKTEQICFSLSGEDCNILKGTGKKTEKIRLSKDKIKAKEQIREKLADSKFRCHSMLGEGKLQFFPGKWFEERPVYGLICSWFAFDDEAKKEFDGITYDEIYGELERKKTKDENGNTISYLEYIYGLKESKTTLQVYEKLQNEGEGSGKDNIKSIIYSNWKIVPNEENGYVIFAVQSPPDRYEELKTAAIAGGIVFLATAATIATLPVGGIGGLAILGVGAAGGSATTGGLVVWQYYENGKYYYAPPIISPLDPDNFKELGISSFQIAP